MNSFENPIKLLRELKGCPLSVLLALSIVRLPVNASWLENMTGYSDKPVTKALELLVEYGYILKLSGQKWQIGSSFQLPLGVESRNNSDISSTTSSSFLTEGNKDIEEAAVEEEPKVGINPIFDRLNEIGIGEPVRSELIKKNYMTLEYLNAHYKKWKSEGIKGLGLLIHRLRSHDLIIDYEDYRRYII